MAPPTQGPPGVPGGPGGTGTITAISGSKLTLRTLNGTETVETSSSTRYYKEMQAITLSDLRTGEVIQVMGIPESSSSSASTRSTPPQPGTGIVEARRITVVEPTFMGRVQSQSNGTYIIVGGEGQLLTVSTSSSTRYYKGPSKTNSSAIADGTFIVAEGTRDSITHLSADVISVAPTPPNPGQPPKSPPRPPRSSLRSASSGSLS
jgi:hypothetical protein